MALFIAEHRSIDVKTSFRLADGQDLSSINWQQDGELSFCVYDGVNAWCGRLPRAEYREKWPATGLQTDLSRFDDLIKLLHPVLRTDIYPHFPVGKLTEFKPHAKDDHTTLYLKGPNLTSYNPSKRDDTLAIRLLQEAYVQEKLLRNPHPNVGSYLGCLVEDGLIVRLAFKRLEETLYELIDSPHTSPESFTFQQRENCMDQVEAAAMHIHSLGLAHNDISPSNIMFSSSGRTILIDMDSCAPLGKPITKGGLVTGWRGPIHGQGREFKNSSIELDELAIQEIRKWLVEDLGQKQLSVHEEQA